MQLWVRHAGLKVVVIFEGRDAAGKGTSAIFHALSERVSPRVDLAMSSLLSTMTSRRISLLKRSLTIVSSLSLVSESGPWASCSVSAKGKVPR